MKKFKFTNLFLFFTLTAGPLFAAGHFPAESSLGLSAVAGLFILGLALNLTPCVYPMLTVTLAVFGTGKEKSKARIITRAVLYVIGIATMYSALGVIASLTGGLFGAIMQSRAVLASIGLLFILLALSMFGLYELRLPSSVANKLGSGKTTGYLGIYLSGLMVGVFAAPCIGPPVIALMTVAGQRGDPIFGFLSFFILSVGLGLPYLILAIFSGMITELPRSGDWMVWVRKALGVILIAAGLFYFSLAAGQSLAFILIPAALAAGGVYLGFFEKSSADKKIFRWVKRITCLVFSGAALFIFLASRAPSIEWQPYGERLLSAGKPSVIYFSAEWCIPCLEMDIRTFTDTDLMDSLEGFTLVKADLTRYDSPASRELRQKYNIAGVPTLVFTDREGLEIDTSRVTGFISAGELTAVAEKVKNYIQTGEYEMVLEERGQEEPSEAKLVADVEWIRPGEPFHIGVLFSMRDNWHVYWVNPGDSGAEPQIEWDIPEGFDIGDIRWPYPQRFEEGPFFTFGHEGELLLSRKITPPSGLEPGSEVRFEAVASWLVCMDICISQDGDFELVLPVADEEPAPAKRWEEKFFSAEKSLPVSDPRWEFSFFREGNDIVLYATPPRGIGEEIIKRAEFFPLEPGLVRTLPVEWSRSEKNYFKRMRLENPSREVEVFEGVLVLPEAAEKMPRALAVEALRRK